MKLYKNTAKIVVIALETLFFYINMNITVFRVDITY